MADALSFLEEDLTCLMCCDVFTDPVTLKCSHSLCEKCLQCFWTTRDVPQCPVCRKECSHDEPTKSLAFRALCESFKKRKPTAVSGDVCPEHKEALKLFCFEDQQPICVVCYTSKKHENHKCSPVDEAAGNLKDDLKTQMDRLHETLADLKKAQENCVKQAELIKIHTSITENQIKKKFEKLHQFLTEEEKKQIRSLRKEMENKDEKLKARLEELSKQISDLSERMAAFWQDMEAENISFLQNYSDTLKRLKCPSVPNRTPVLQQYQQYPIQTVIFTTWARMQNLVEQPPVTLDPDTASNKLQVSDDYTSVEYVEVKLHVSDNPKRLQEGVLASQGFSSGVHCWDVEVGDSNNWTLGVMGETVNRKKLCKMDPKNSFWCFRNVDGKYKKGTKPISDFDSNERPNVIRLQLDFDKGELRFIEPFRKSSLCTYTGGFPERVFPYFNTGDPDSPLSLFPANKQNV
ncbi:zinc-binding protein A33-like [Sinocyclocheilus rhinocerous]|uniref:zinc-binding protein A33-like n=1 Tax=Sinocyclocheilus rhinocerous TaxID=307959 RepID=UPI0007B8D83D|nr:PREDICTED: zinc-binding protein A33-like [Sinocyclocheilus rhinocerous]